MRLLDDVSDVRQVRDILPPLTDERPAPLPRSIWPVRNGISRGEISAHHIPNTFR